MHNIALEQFQKAADKFNLRDDIKNSAESIVKIKNIIDDIVKNFNTLDGAELSEAQVKLSGYKFYLADVIADLLSKSKYLENWLKEQRARKWKEYTEIIVETEGKVKNKEQIENMFLTNHSEVISMQSMYEAEHSKLRLKSYAIDDILTALVQCRAALKREVELSKSL